MMTTTLDIDNPTTTPPQHRSVHRGDEAADLARGPAQRDSDTDDVTDDPAASSEELHAPRAGLDRRGAGHGMLNAGRVASRWRVALRHIVMRLIGKLPGTQFKSRLIQRVLGVKMGRDVGIAYGVFLDPYDPTMISFGDNVIVGFEARIFVHMFTLSRQRVKPVTVGSNVLIGACCIIAPGVTIGDGATIAPGTVVTRNIPAGALVMGNQMTVKKRDGAGRVG